MNQKAGLFGAVNNLADEKQRDSKSDKRGKKNLWEIQELVGDVRPEDGLDPRYEAKRRRHNCDEARPGFTHGVHKQEQFGGQIQSTIDSALLCATNPILNRLTVREVVKQKAVFMVVVEPRDSAVPVDMVEAAQALEKAGPMLRREVAAAITRKEVPQLNFVVLPAGTEKIGE
jgi:ribosome-binding factor A